MHEINNKYIYGFVIKPEGKEPLERCRCRWDEIDCFSDSWVVQKHFQHFLNLVGYIATNSTAVVNDELE
jgi:hypothetical protein